MAGKPPSLPHDPQPPASTTHSMSHLRHAIGNAGSPIPDAPLFTPIATK